MAYITFINNVYQHIEDKKSARQAIQCEAQMIIYFTFTINNCINMRIKIHAASNSVRSTNDITLHIIGYVKML